MEDTITILGIDPGANIGVSIYTISVPSLIVKNIETVYLNLNARIIESPIRENNLLRLEYLSNYIHNLITYNSPHIVALEAAFVNSRFPKSGLYLAQYISTITTTCLNFNRFIKIYNYPPKLVKSAIGATGNAKKEDMYTTVSNIPEIKRYVNTALCTEHEIDSLAIGYLALLQLRNDPLSLLTL